MDCNAKELAKLAAEALSEKKCEDVTILDISAVSTIADYFIIADGANANQLAAMRNAVEERLMKAGCPECRIEGNADSTWILMDFQDIIVHIFSKEDRLFYDLERIWRDGEKVKREEL